MYEAVAKKLKALREDADKTQTKIASALNIDQSYYAKYENGKHPIPLHHLKTLCEYYHVSADYILEIPDTHDRTKEEIIEREKQIKEWIKIEKIETIEEILRWAEYQGHIRGDIDLVLATIAENLN